MNATSAHKKDQRISAVITLLVSLILLLCIYFYRFTRTTPKPEEVVTTMLINFGDNNNGNGTEEPAPQEGSLASESVKEEVQPVEQPSHSEPITKPQPKTITGKDKTRTVQKSQKTRNKKQESRSKSQEPRNKNQKTKTKSQKKTTNKQKSGDGKGNAAIGNLLRGRGDKKGSQGKNGKNGNAGDPLGGNGNGNSKIGVDRKLVGFIPGTMGRGGTQPTHTCSASGTIKIAYIVDKTGRVTSARRIGGISDPCAVKTTVAWVKKYVKAEKANFSSKGTYTIRF